jgi:hypothetical protein
VVALINYKEGRDRGGGWLLDSYEACSEFSPAPPEATDDLPPKEHTEGTKEQQYSGDQEYSGGAESEEGRCGETRKELRFQTWFYVTNDLPGCPKGGVLTGTEGADEPPDRAGLDGKYGDDKVRGLGGSDEIYGSSGSDVIYGGPGNDFLCSGGLDGCGEGGNYDDVLYGGDHSDDLWASNGEDVLYGEDGNDRLVALDAKGGGRDKLYCGRGKDKYEADPIDYVDSSCEEGKFIDEKGMVVETGGPPLILLAGAALLLGSGLVLSRYTIRRVS